MNKIYYLCTPFTFVMNILERYSIAYKGLSEGRHHFDYEVDERLMEAFGNEEIRDVKANVSVDLLRHPNMLQFTVAIKGEATVDCDRCLEPLLVPIDFNGELVVRFSEQEKDYDGEIMWISAGESEVNLAQYIYESICLSLPYQRVHEHIEDCNQDMVSSFKIVTPEEFEQLATPKLEKEGDEQWEKLKAFKETLENKN